jgi:phytoene/squalene synthetase
MFERRHALDGLHAVDAFQRRLGGLSGADLNAFEEQLCAGDPAVNGWATLPLAPLRRLIEGRRIEQRDPRFTTFDELVAFCALAANPVGELVLHVFGQAAPPRVALADRIWTGLQLIGYLQDGRRYLPRADVDRFGDTPALIRFAAERAGAWLDAGAPLVSTLHGTARLYVGAKVAGGRAGLARLAGRHGGQVVTQWLAATVRRPG